MTISQDQIDDLYAFTRRHFIEHYDLQTELVDHLANDIETVWIEQPNLSYMEARDSAFKKFGVFGFMEVAEERQKAMGKRYKAFLWDEFKTWLSLPKLSISITIFIICYIAFSSSFSSVFLIIAYGGVAFWSTYKGIKLNREFRRRKEKSNKKWMLEEMIYKRAGGAGCLLISQLPTWYNIWQHCSSNFWLIIGASLFTSLFVIYMYVSLELLPNKAEELLNDTYPEFCL